MILSNRTYDVLKYLAQIILPAIGALYFALSQIWGLPKTEEIVGTITAVDAFLGVALGLSTNVYNRSDARYDGHIEVDDSEQKKMYSMVLHSDPEKLDQKKSVTFKIQPTTSKEDPL